MRTSILSSRTRRDPKIGSKVKRKSLQMYDLFSLPKGTGSIYMHTGCRTRPPSGGNTEVSLVVDGKSIINRSFDHFKTLFTQGSREVIGFQSIKVAGDISRGEDGAIVSYDDTKLVIYEGRAEVVLPD